MLNIKEIQKSVQEVAEAISTILEIDVTVINNNLERIAATGKYKSLVGKKLPKGCYYDEILRKATSLTFIERINNHDCQNCESIESCEELATIGYPIYSKDGKILGVMGLIAFDEKSRNYIYKNHYNINIFLEKLGNLLAGNLIYENTIEKLSINNQEIMNLINSLDYGIIITDENLVIKNMNNEMEKLFGEKREGLINTNISEVLDINLENLEEKRILPIKSKLKNSKNQFMVKVLFNQVNQKVRSYLFEISNYSNVLKNAYDILENKENISFDQILGSSFKLKNTVTLAKQVSSGDSSIMLRGESGTGKELFARAIHGDSARRDKMFIAINCASIPDNLLESELFGYEKGAFTDANKSGKIGRFELANGGTLFLDEIGDLPIHLQPKLLRVLQEGSFTRLGGNKKIKVDFRLITATNRDLEAMIKNQEFREDLYYRLNVIPINIPALRERASDIPLIAQEKLKGYCVKLNKEEKYFSDQLLETFESYGWPGNIRELENVIEYLVNISDKEEITADLLPEYFKSSLDKEPDYKIEKASIKEDMSLRDLTEEYEREILSYYIEKYGKTTSDKKEISKILKVDLSTLYRKLYRYGL